MGCIRNPGNTITKSQVQDPFHPWAACYILSYIPNFHPYVSCVCLWTSTACQNKAIYSPFPLIAAMRAGYTTHTCTEWGPPTPHQGHIFTHSLLSVAPALLAHCSTAGSPAAACQVLGKKPPFQFIEAGLLQDPLGVIREFTANISQRPDFVVSGELGLPCWIMSQHFLLWPTEMWFGQQTIAQCETQSIPHTSWRGT